VPTSPPAPLRRGVLPNLRYDAPAGLVVFLVALPLCLAIAVASEAPLLSGLVAGVIAGLVVAPLSGSQLSVSGPAAGLTVIVAAGAATLGGFEHLLAATLIAGAMQLVAGIARLGFLANFFPASVIEGMLAGIGVLLILKQIPLVLGRPQDFNVGDPFPLVGAQSKTFGEIYAALQGPTPGVIVVAVACLLVLALWQLSVLRSSPWLRLVPGPLVAVLLGVALNELFGFVGSSLHADSGSGHLVAIPVPATPVELLGALPQPSFVKLWTSDLWLVAGAIAAVASVETLLSIEAVDKIDPWRRASNTNRELLAQGAGNVLAGLAGGLPITSVIVRSSANVQAGGRTRSSAFLHGVLLLVLVVAVPMVLNRIPLAALAAVLILVGYNLARVGLFRAMYLRGAEQFVPFALTVFVTVFFDLLVGVGVGIVAGIIMVLIGQMTTAIAVEREGDDWLVLFTKDVHFLHKTRLRRALASIPDGARVVIDGGRAQSIDHDVRAMVDAFAVAAIHRDIEVTVRGLASQRHPIRLPGAR